jgi:SynChlorMet cassette protein ScmD
MIEKPVASPSVVYREEFDDWTLLYDPDSGEAFGLNPVSAFVWKHLDGKHTIDDILKELKEQCSDVPESARSDIDSFIKSLIEKGLAGSEA